MTFALSQIDAELESVNTELGGALRESRCSTWCMLPGTDEISCRMSLESAVAERDKMQTDLGAQEGTTRSLQKQLTIVTDELTEKSDFASSVSTTMVLQLADQRYELAVAKLTVVKWRYS